MHNLKSLVSLWDRLAEGLDIPSKDRAVFGTRANAEGMTFLTKTLPQLGKAFDDFLVCGEYDYSTTRFHLKDGLPLFLGSLFKKIHLDITSVEVTAAYMQKIRQLTLLFYKTEVPYDKQVLGKSVEDFVTRDTDLTQNLSSEEEAEMRKAVRRVLASLDPLDILPRHGSGAVANRLKNHEKWHSFRFIPRLDSTFPYSEHFFYSPTHLCDGLEDLLTAEVVEEPASRLVFVPKDSRGPRLICCEPAEFMFVQQGLKDKLYSHIEGTYPTRGYINFTDQTINQDLARQASIDKEMSTLDLSEASDRVSWDLLKKVLPSRWVQALDACRTRFVDLPGVEGTHGPLSMFAPMGSACTFPIEALYFWALLVGNLHTNVWVYGDDIILPTDLVDKAIPLLERAGLKVNVRKSCYRTHFRESCGGEYYAGYDVGYVKVRCMPLSDDVSQLRHIEFAQLVAEKYGISVGLKILTWVDTIYGVTPTSNVRNRPGVFYHPDAPVSRNYLFFKRRWSRDLHRFEHKIRLSASAVIKPRTSSQFHWNEILRKHNTRDTESVVGCYQSKFAKPKWVWKALD